MLGCQTNYWNCENSCRLLRYLSGFAFVMVTVKSETYGSLNQSGFSAYDPPQSQCHCSCEISDCTWISNGSWLKEANQVCTNYKFNIELSGLFLGDGVPLFIRIVQRSTVDYVGLRLAACCSVRQMWWLVRLETRWLDWFVIQDLACTMNTCIGSLAIVTNCTVMFSVTYFWRTMRFVPFVRGPLL
jgi:hypothetical protein